ncbi:hypothetical protein K440DRAFT_213116 [Wilcoxina mikolae CBS 423.85]|nr:hypothetical protein K440DRAFT_213116 [Wilcoxina mikolae CBS 423.85]
MLGIPVTIDITPTIPGIFPVSTLLAVPVLCLRLICLRIMHHLCSCPFDSKNMINIHCRDRCPQDIDFCLQ